MTSRRIGLCTATSAIALVLCPGLALAQATPAAEASAGDAGGEIIVTAQKRSEDIRTVPISVSVLSGAALKDQQIANYDDLSRAVPGVAFNAVAGEEGRTNIVIRGVSSVSGASTVGVYLDDVSITVPNLYRDGSIEVRLPDIERVEVLRGPQGTLYGDSSEGGTIRYIATPANPDAFGMTLTTDASGTKHGGANFADSATFNLPVVPDKLSLHAAVNYENDSGWVDNYNQQGVLQKKGVNSANSLTAHVSATWTPDSTLTITPAVFYQRATNADNAAFYPNLGLWQQDKEVAEPSRDTVVLGSLSIKKTLGFADLTSVTGFFDRIASRQEDGTYFNSTAFAEFFLDPIYPQYQPQNDSVIANLPSAVEIRTHYRNFSQELRLSSNDTSAGASWLKWVIGAYYSTQSVHNTDYQTINGINSTFQSIYGVPMEQSLVETSYGNPTYGQPGGGAAITLFPGDVDESDNRTYRQQQVAVFGQVGITFAKGWKLDLGGRFSAAHEDFVSVETGFYQIGNLGYQTPGQPASAPYTQDGTSTAFLPKATLYHDVAATSSVYASVAKGFRLPGPTGPIVYGPTSVCNGDFQAIGQTTQPTQFKSDSLWTYEVGTKNEFAGRRIRLNASGYLTNWNDIQQQIYLPTCGYYFTSNIGNARIWGAEAEFSFKLTPSLSVSATGSVNDAKVIQSNNPIDVAVGQHLIDVPDFTATAGANYLHPVGPSGAVIALVNYAYTGHSYGSYLVTDTNYYNPSYGVVNASVGYRFGANQLTLYVKNLLNNETIIQRPEINTVTEGYTVHPRTIGLTLKLVE
ncbi:TonB-dependent receptor [Novosphingobium sp. FSW06-99]|uniref:TonB-dependent receptor n=1 Tax=Novosphingobium sp. FSW06-99 TaxID=1739113 RepID=UPI00076CC46E|nr:TonB-dependent receptor [Novosphingobium sp. FSW06-99]KUR80213.1 TonB-dependent receptor [Novosphingobium sp. FSW06-99]